jgi:hypothetical protein
VPFPLQSPKDDLSIKKIQAILLHEINTKNSLLYLNNIAYPLITTNCLSFFERLFEKVYKNNGMLARMIGIKTFLDWYYFF